MNNMKEAFRKAGHEGQRTPDKSRPGRPQAPSAKFSLRDDYTLQAEQVIRQLMETLGRDYAYFTTSKIRNILAQVSEIYNEVINGPDEALSAGLKSRIEYLKVRLVYECGRERVVKRFVERAGLLNLLNNIGDSKENFKKFARYMEALVAYHRFLGGQD